MGVAFSAVQVINIWRIVFHKRKIVAKNATFWISQSTSSFSLVVWTNDDEAISFPLPFAWLMAQRLVSCQTLLVEILEADYEFSKITPLPGQTENDYDGDRLIMTEYRGR